MPVFTLLMVAGLLAWSLIEYVLHRFVLHGLWPFQQWHALHHDQPHALIHVPAVLGALPIGGVVFLPALVLGGLWPACAFTLGVLVGYVAYAITHHATHHGRAGPHWLRRLKLVHAMHHSVNPPAGFGVTSAFWDRVCGTQHKGFS